MLEWMDDGVFASSANTHHIQQLHLHLQTKHHHTSLQPNDTCWTKANTALD